MTPNGIIQITCFFFCLLLCVKPLGAYMAIVYEGKTTWFMRLLSPIERGIYRLSGIDAKQEMGWKTYLTALLWFNAIGFIVLFLLLKLQAYLPFNPEHLQAMATDLAFNTAASFVTNTDWQAYSGETSLSYFSQMSGLTVQNFLSAATGIALLMALIRGLIKHESNSLGNFWADMVRSVVYILLPLALFFAIVLNAAGVIQNLKPYQPIHLLQPVTIAKEVRTTQIIPMGPVASQVAIAELGSNGGGFFNVNAAHPLANPTPLTNWLEMLAILLIPAALCYTFGVMVGDKRQGWVILLAMSLIFIPMAGVCIYAEQAEQPMLQQLGIDVTAGNMEGKETRFGIVDSALWTSATTATSNGSVNAALNSFTPLGGLIPLWLMHLGEVVFGGVGSGLYGMLMMMILTVFVAGLMVGRTPEYLGKKIEPYEMKMAVIAVLLMPMTVLLLTAMAVVAPVNMSSLAHVNTHGFSVILYAFTSMGSNNGSVFAGMNTNTAFYNIVGGIEMLLMRFGMAIPVLALAGSLVRKKIIPATAGTLSTSSFLFIGLLIAIIFILGALTFFPALSLGPIAEYLQYSWGLHGH